MKVYLDIIANHTADVITYRECPQGCPYRSKAYTAYVPVGEERVKVPAWLNDTKYYHNRGNSTFEGESSLFGDFSGLDDLDTENPRVVTGFIDIYQQWIDRYRIDGYRIDTARHVNGEFWKKFVPAIRSRVAANGIPNFHVFGEVALTSTDVAPLARYTREEGLPSVLDFAFFTAVRETVAANAGTDVLARVFASDGQYEGGEAAALQLPTFISNHDNGRFAWFVRTDRPGVSDIEALKRVSLAYAMLLTLRGVPVVYYGDEQGFAGIGNDQSARQDMFATQVAEYQQDRRLGSNAATAQPFDPNHPLYRLISELSKLRVQNEALRRGRQVTRSSSAKPGIFAVSRLDPDSGREIVVAFNTSIDPAAAAFPVEQGSSQFRALHGRCAPEASVPGRYTVTLAPLDFVICAAQE
jgi:glycosidase